MKESPWKIRGFLAFQKGKVRLELKEAALAKTSPLHAIPGRYRPGDKLLAFLHGL